MKLNNKGFAISTIMYMVFVLAVLVMAITLTILNSRKLILDKQRNIALTNIYENNITTHRTDCTVLAPFGGTFVEATDSDTHKGIVYMNPIDISATCNATIASQNVNSYGKPTGITTGCMKFYIYDDSGDYYKMILDHNTSGNVAWLSFEDYIAAGGTQEEWDAGNAYLIGPITATRRLREDTQGWMGNPTFITPNEIAHIVGSDRYDTIKWDENKSFKQPITDANANIGWYYLDGSGEGYNNWQVQVADSINKSKYAWLYDYTNGCIQYGCNYEDNNEYPKPNKDF